MSFVSRLDEKANGQVNLQTGSAVYTLPMFDWHDNKSRLNCNVSIGYSSHNGIKVEESASSVGQGWNLFAGGLVSRIQAGAPDDQVPNAGDGTIEDVNRYPAGYLYNPVDALQGCPKQLVYYPIFGSANHVYKQHNALSADREKDYFSFEFNGKQGVFVLDKNNSDKGIMLGDSKMKVWFQRDAAANAAQHIRTSITAFFIQDEEGLIYSFSQMALEKVLRTHSSFPGPNNYPTPQPDYENGGVYYESAFDELPLSSKPYVVSGWYLTQIKDPLTQRIVTFNYIIRTINAPSGDQISYNWSGGDMNSGAPTPSTKYVKITYGLSVASVPVLSSIQLPDKAYVNLQYQSKPRFDMPGDYALKSVDVSYDGHIFSSYQLSTSYFIFNGYGTPISISQKLAARLCLRSVQRIGVDLKAAELPTQFEYYTGSSAEGDFVPPPHYYAKDIWGYYNGTHVNDIYSGAPPVPIIKESLIESGAQLNSFNFTQLSTLCFMTNMQGGIYSYHTIGNGLAKNGLLKKITYPAGATLTYEYEQNRHSVMTGVSTADQALASSDDFGGGVHVSKTTQTDGGYSNDELHPITTLYNYVDASGKTSQWGFDPPDNITNSNYSFALAGANHPLIGACSYDYKYPGIESIEDAQSVKQQSDASNKLVTAFTVASWGTELWGMIFKGENPILLIYDILQTLLNYLVSNCSDGGQSGFTVTYSNSNIKNVNPYPAQFSRVEIIRNSSSAPVGKTVYDFTDYNDYPLWAVPRQGYGTVPDESSLQQRYAYWAYGLVKKISIYNSDNQLVQQTENSYDWSKAKTAASEEVSCNCNVLIGASLRSDTWSSYSNPANVTYATSEYGSVPDYKLYVNPYTAYTGRVELTDVHERSFVTGAQAQFLEQNSHYEYNPKNYQLSKLQTVGSNGDVTIKEYHYPLDFDISSGPIATLAANNIVNLTISTYTSIRNSGESVPKYMGGNVLQLTQLPSGDIEPLNKFTARSTKPVINYSFSPTDPYNYPGLTLTSTNFYDENENLGGSYDEGGHKSTILYDYDGKYVVAALSNADPAIDKVFYTSFETPATGHWTVNGNPSYAASSMTGSQSLVLNNVSLSASYSSTQHYRLSFWATGNVTITGATATLELSQPVINGFTFYQYDVQPGNLTLTLSGSGNLDEVRLYPAAARMRTATYTPLIGKTSECDENNKILYFGYDDLGRMSDIRDDHRNIVKLYEYNFKK